MTHTPKNRHSRGQHFGWERLSHGKNSVGISDRIDVRTNRPTRFVLPISKKSRARLAASARCFGVRESYWDTSIWQPHSLQTPLSMCCTVHRSITADTSYSQPGQVTARGGV